MWSGVFVNRYVARPIPNRVVNCGDLSMPRMNEWGVPAARECGPDDRKYSDDFLAHLTDCDGSDEFVG